MKHFANEIYGVATYGLDEFVESRFAIYGHIRICIIKGFCHIRTHTNF
jgi:hypothetical protein